MENKSKTGVLGGGISALSFAYFYEKEIDIFEKESSLGGLCRSFQDKDGVAWDIGPHITFSKNKMLRAIKVNNRIFFISMLFLSEVLQTTFFLSHKMIFFQDGINAL